MTEYTGRIVHVVGAIKENGVPVGQHIHPNNMWRERTDGLYDGPCDAYDLTNYTLVEHVTGDRVDHRECLRVVQGEEMTSREIYDAFGDSLGF
jgi:hypothetical protein